MKRAIVTLALLLAACGSADNKPQVESRIECRTDANGRQICTVYKPKEDEQ